MILVRMLMPVSSKVVGLRRGENGDPPAAAAYMVTQCRKGP
jgi:hypothetical protein